MFSNGTSKIPALLFVGSLIFFALGYSSSVQAQEPGDSAETGSGTAPAREERQADSQSTLPEPPRLPAPEDAKAIAEPNRVWVDMDKQAVYVDGYVCLREGMLEMFACPVGTKEHESVVAVYSRAQVIHAALLAVGAEPGHPARFQPEFRPPSGTEIEIEVRWREEEEQWKSVRAQQWVRDIRTEKPMTHPWVFGGSGFWKDEETGKEHYMAESGDLICVSNFSTAMLDIPVKSSQVNEGLLFAANTDKVPPLGTPVRLVLNPKKGKQENEQ